MINLLQGRRLIDLSVTLDNNPWTDPPPLLPNIEYQDHQQGWPEMAAMFPGLEKAQMPGEEAWASERLTVTPHNGTHMDAPWHYSSTTNGGEPAFGIDELPLEWCLRPGVRLDFRHVADGAILQPEDLQRELARIDYRLSPLDIVLINTAAGAC
ncbi:cyclase family protein, partial [Klebsiella pneumoniae]